MRPSFAGLDQRVADSRVGCQASLLCRIVTWSPCKRRRLSMRYVGSPSSCRPTRRLTCCTGCSPGHRCRPTTSETDRPAPVYESWTQYLADTTAEERQQWCRVKAKHANRTRLMSGPPDAKISADDVWVILSAAEGRCEHCGSLAIERRPSGPDGRPAAWASIGRRVGSLGHRLARFNGGSNRPTNLCWSCLWCNTWPEERRPGATDHGGHHPQR